MERLAVYQTKKPTRAFIITPKNGKYRIPRKLKKQVKKGYYKVADETSYKMCFPFLLIAEALITITISKLQTSYQKGIEHEKN